MTTKDRNDITEATGQSTDEKRSCNDNHLQDEVHPTVTICFGLIFPDGFSERIFIQLYLLFRSKLCCLMLLEDPEIHLRLFNFVLEGGQLIELTKTIWSTVFICIIHCKESHSQKDQSKNAKNDDEDAPASNICTEKNVSRNGTGKQKYNKQVEVTVNDERTSCNTISILILLQFNQIVNVRLFLRLWLQADTASCWVDFL